MEKPAYFFNMGDSRNVCIGSGKKAFADQTLRSLKREDRHGEQSVIHMVDGKIYFTDDGNPFYGGSKLCESKEAAIALAEKQGYQFDSQAKTDFLVEVGYFVELSNVQYDTDEYVSPEHEQRPVFISFDKVDHSNVSTEELLDIAIEELTERASYTVKSFSHLIKRV